MRNSSFGRRGNKSKDCSPDPGCSHRFMDIAELYRQRELKAPPNFSSNGRRIPSVFSEQN